MDWSDRRDRASYLKEKLRLSLHERARSAFGNDSFRILSNLRDAFEKRRYTGETFDSWARRVLRRCAKKRDKVRYVQVCIERDLFINGLEHWLAMNPDPADLLSIEEYREIDAEELDAYYREAAKVEQQLAVIYGERTATRELAARIGKEKALELYAKLQMALGSDEAERIIGGAWWPWIKKPEKFIEAALQNEIAFNRRKGSIRSIDRGSF